MAYMAFPADFAGSEVVAGPPASFTATEWAVIRLARRDSLASLDTPTAIGAFMRRAFGLHWRGSDDCQAERSRRFNRRG